MTSHRFHAPTHSASRVAGRGLSRHLNITEEPQIAKARLQRDCIPQYEVGWRDYMGEFHKNVLVNLFDFRLKVCGPWWQGGVGVNDCLRSAWDAAQGLVNGVKGKRGSETGLEMYKDRPMVEYVLRDGAMRILRMDERAKGGRFPRLESALWKPPKA